MNYIIKKSIIASSVLFALSSCYKDSDYAPEALAKSDSANIQISGGGVSIPADSFSLSKIAIVFPYDADSSKCSVSLTTDLGTFVESGTTSITITAKNNTDSAKKVAFATLKSGTLIGLAHIQCYLYSFTKALVDTFYRSYPDFINLSASTLSVKPSNGSSGEVSFTCKIYKNVGFPSQRNVVNLIVEDTNNMRIGSLRTNSFLSDNLGSTQYTYVLGDSIANGRSSQYYGKLTAIAIDTIGPGQIVKSLIQLISSQ